MKTASIAKLTHLTIGFAALAVSAGISVAKPASTEKGLVEHVVELHAPNNATQTATVWIPVTTARNVRTTASTSNRTEKVIELHVPNGTTQSITVWTGKYKP